MTRASEDIRKIVDTLCKKFSDEGKLIEAGWRAFEIQCLENADPVQRAEMRKAWFLGAQHLYASLMNIMEEDREPTETDLKRMSLVDAELKEFIKQFKEDHTQ